MLDYNKRHQLVTKVDEANNDSKQLFRALNSILGNKDESPLPMGTSNSQLADDCRFLLKQNKLNKGKIYKHTSIST